MWFHSPTPWSTFTFPLLFGSSDWGRSQPCAERGSRRAIVLSHSYTCVSAINSWLWGSSNPSPWSRRQEQLLVQVAAARPLLSHMQTAVCTFPGKYLVEEVAKLLGGEGRQGIEEERHEQDISLMSHRSPKHTQDEVFSHRSWFLPPKYWFYFAFAFFSLFFFLPYISALLTVCFR